jgi:arsenate reductase
VDLGATNSMGTTDNRQMESAAGPHPEHDGRRKILFLCTHNSCRSQVAEGWARHPPGDRWEPCSAGIEPTHVDLYAMKVMAEAGVNISFHRTKSIREVQDIECDYVMTVCDQAREQCPYFPARVGALHAGFGDPPALAQDVKDEQEVLAIHRRDRDEITSFVEKLPQRLEARSSRHA